MVRSPLTHRIATDDVLNSVACLLPRFDGMLQLLDLQSASVRAAIRAFEGGQVSTLYEFDSSRPYL